MAELTFQSFPDYCVFTVRGNVTAAEVIEGLINHTSSLRSPNIIWDFLEAAIMVNSPQDFKDVAHAAEEVLAPLFASRRKAAFVTRSELRGMTLSIYITVASREKIPADYAVFKTLEEAVEWITQKS